MRRLINILCFLGIMCSALQAHEYVPSSVLCSGNIVKIQVPSTGTYCLTYEQIEAMGIYPPQVRLLGYGGNLIDQDFRQTRLDDVPSIPFYMYVGDDGVFSSNDYILFYAKGPLGWKWDGKNYSRTRNYYANYGCYFLSDNAGEQKILNKGEEIVSSNPYEVYTHTALQLHEEEQYNLVDLNGIAGGGREWYGDMLTTKTNSKTIPFTFDDVDPSKLMRCHVTAASTIASTQLTIRVASNSQTKTFPTLYSEDKASIIESVISTYPKSNYLPVSLSYSSSQGSASAYINYVEMQVPCSLRLRSNYLEIRNTEHVGQTTPSRYHLVGADSNTKIWNITDPAKAYLVATSWVGDTLCWLGVNQQPQVYLAVQVTDRNWPTPASRGQVYNQNLHYLIRGKHHIIVTPEEFRDQAERLKQVHEAYNKNDKWWVVSDEEVYNEFSSGTPDASAIRWMMKYLWDTFKDTEQAPKSVLMFGDGSFDNRQILSYSGTPTLITYQSTNSTNDAMSYATDDYFGWLKDNAGITGNRMNDTLAQLEISVGRLPISTYEQAVQMVDKIATYLLNANAGSWKQQLCFLADDGDHGQHVHSAEMAAKKVQQLAPQYILNKIYLDAYEQESSASGESYPLAYSTYSNLLKSGVLLMDYAGHGSPNNICSEMFLTRKQVESMTNTNQGIWVLATCNFSRFDQKELSTAEVAVLNPVGGAIAVMSSDRTAYVSSNNIINMNYCAQLVHRLSNGIYPYTIGEALKLAKNQMGSDGGKLPYLLLGDPSLKLNYPEPYQVLISHMPDTLRALDLVTIEGYIANQEKDTVSFDGQLTINVFDKKQTVYTRDNDEPNPDDKVKRPFDDYPNKLFMGQGDITNGKFTTQFRMPKDLRYNIDSARLTLYAIGTDATGTAEAIGYTNNFQVGGSSPYIIDDNQGPDIQLYLNTPFFNEGDEVNATPHFYAELSDQNGINAAGSGIGHDLLLTIDNNVKQTYVVNNYFTTTTSYQKGLVSYPMSEIADGYHILSFRAWDMPGNASTKTLGFNVNHELGPELRSLLVYPNPVSHSGELTMQLSHDRPDERMSMDINFYDLAGHTIWTTSRVLSGYDGKAQITLNMLETHLPAGTYIYRFRIQTSTQTSTYYSGKIIVY